MQNLVMYRCRCWVMGRNVAFCVFCVRFARDNYSRCGRLMRRSGLVLKD